jgi:hypothetical protein
VVETLAGTEIVGEASVWEWVAWAVRGYCGVEVEVVGIGMRIGEAGGLWS